MESTKSAGQPLGSASTLLFCRLCQAVYRQPKLLPCLHSFCKPCLEDVVVQHGEDGASITCPLCSHKTMLLSAYGPLELPDNCFLSRMCQEYITEVQSHIMARSAYSIPAKGSSEFAALRSKLTEELSHSKFPPSPTHRSRHGSQEDIPPREMALPYAAKTSSDEGSDQTDANTMETIHNTSMLQNKIMHLQGQALRVTYAIDYVNQCMTEWHQHKEDLKRAVQRRSAQFQFFIKRMEHQLLTHIDDKHVDDDFYISSDKSKTELRKVLKNILHEVSVLKSIQELGEDNEINTLCHNLLGKSVGMVDVMLKKFHYEMVVPTESIEEIVGTFFGEVRLHPEESNVFSPELIDFNEVPMGNLTPQQSEEGLSSTDKEIYILGDEVQGVTTDRTSSARSFSDSTYAKYSNDPSLDDHTRQHLAQFQTARETLRTRRREILVRGQKTREGALSLMEEFQAHPRSAMRKSRVQSLDRTAAAIAKSSSKRGLAAKLNMNAISDVTCRHSDAKSLGHSQHALDSHHEHSHIPPHGSGSSHYAHRFLSENVHIPSPLTEEVSLPSTVQRKLVKQTSDPHVTPEGAASGMCLPSHTQSAMENLNRQLLDPTGANLFPQRRHSSDHYIPASDGNDQALNQLHNKSSTRPLRKAISSVADKKQKIEILRENWQKRKEILIQNEGFVSPDHAARHSPKPSSHEQFDIISSNLSIETTTQNVPSDTETHRHPSSDEPSHQGEESCSQQVTSNKSSETNNGIITNAATATDFTPKAFQTENRTDITIFSNETKSINLESTDYPHPRQYLYEVKYGERVNRRHSTDTVTASKDMHTTEQKYTPAASHEINGATSQMQTSTLIDSKEPLRDQGATPEPDTDSPPSSPSPQAPASPTAGDSTQKLKLREIARKKKERWRHLTIH